MKTRAAIAWEPNRPLETEEVDLEGRKEGEVLIRIVTASLWHTVISRSPARIRSRRGNRHPPLPARHRSRVARVGPWWRARSITTPRYGR